VRVCLQGHQPFAAAVHAIYETLKVLRNVGRAGQLPPLASAELLTQVTREADYDRWTKEFLGG
jgi:carboxyvinyl-carboxyphosphonate phosphorylmutase